MQKTQSGSTILVAGLGAAVLAVFCLIGWYVHAAVQTPTSRSKQATSSAAQTQSASKNFTPAGRTVDNLKEYSDSATGVSFRYPSEWLVNSSGDPSGVGYRLALDVHKRDAPTLDLSIVVRSKNAKDAIISADGAPTHTLPATEKVLQTVETNNSSYSLVGFNDGGDQPFYEVNLERCATQQSCLAYIAKDDGSITVLITTQQGHGAPMDLQSAEYRQMVSLIETLKF
jgi:hypothetical protein